MQKCRLGFHMVTMSVTQLNVQNVCLDKDNPRIAPFIEMYGTSISSDMISLALNDSAPNGNSYANLRDSIKANGGIINPIIVTHSSKDNSYTVVEGNTRLRIYQEFIENGVPGEWESIPAIVYEDMPESQKHAIRLQAHLIGPREWSRYAKAKYLTFLSNEACMTNSQILDFCGGAAKRNEIEHMIGAYKDIEKYYRPLLESDADFDPRKFSYFEELQNQSIIRTLAANNKRKDDFARWVYSGKINTAQNVRDLTRVLQNEDAAKCFLEDDNATIEDAMRYVHAAEISDSGNSLGEIDTYSLIRELSNRIGHIEHNEVKQMKADPGGRQASEYARLYTLLQDLMDDISPESSGE